MIISKTNLFLFSLFSLLLILTSPKVWAAKAKPLLPTKEYTSSLDSIDEAIGKLYVGTDPQPIPKNFKNKLVFTPDLTKIEVDAIYELINDKSTSNDQKEINYIRYTSGDERLTQAFIDAKKAGIKISAVFLDLNTVASVDFKEKESHVGLDQQNRISFKEESDEVKLIKGLLSHGLQLNKEIISQPIYNKSLTERIPIQHEKALLLKCGDKKITYYGTANNAPNPRFNTIQLVNDPLFYDLYLEHLRDLKDAYTQGKPTSKVVSTFRPIIVYPDGSIDFAFTNGQYNPNDRIVELLQNKNYELIDATISEFVITYRDLVNALKEALIANPKAKVTVISDDRFGELRGWGLLPVLAGVDIQDPFNRDYLAFTPDLWARINSYIYQRPAIDPKTGEERIETFQDGPPTARHVWHDKTFILKFKDKNTNKEMSFVFTGSFNASGNVVNADFQTKTTTKSNSWIPRVFEFAIKNTIKSQSEYAVPAVTGLLRNALGELFKITDLDVPLETAKKIQKSILERDEKTLQIELKKVSEIVTKLSSTLKPEEKQARFEQLMSWIHWYNKNIPLSNSFESLRIRRFFNIAMIIANPNKSKYEISKILDSIIWREGMSLDKARELITRGTFELQKITKTHLKNNLKTAKTYDWDDTIMYMPTKIVLFNKTDNSLKEVSTGEFAEVRNHIGQPGEWKNWEIRTSPTENSFKYFRTDPSQNYFISDIKQALKQNEKIWMTSKTESFIKRLETEESAMLTTIETARGHTAQEMREGVKVLLKYWEDITEKKYHLPPLENFITTGAATNPSQEKANRIKPVLDFYYRIGMKEWTFYDDDIGNVNVMNAMLEIEKSHWTNMTVKVIHVTNQTTDQTTNQITNQKNMEKEMPQKRSETEEQTEKSKNKKQSHFQFCSNLFKRAG